MQFNNQKYIPRQNLLFLLCAPPHARIHTQPSRTTSKDSWFKKKSNKQKIQKKKKHAKTTTKHITIHNNFINRLHTIQSSKLYPTTKKCSFCHALLHTHQFTTTRTPTHIHTHTHTHTHTPLLSSKIIRQDHPLKPSAMLKKNNNTQSFSGTSLSATSLSGTSVSGASVSGASVSRTSVFGTAKAKTNGTDGYPRDGKTWRRRVHPSQLSVSGASACAFRLCHPSPAIQLK